MDTIDLDDLFDTIRSYSDVPVPESVLLERFFSDARDVLTESPGQRLFEMHFTLYHHLYRLADTLSGGRFFLFMKSMYIYLLLRPEPGNCSFFDPDQARFCGAETGGADAAICPFHGERNDSLKESGALSFSSLRGYYLDAGNLNPDEANRMANLSKGILMYSASDEEVERSLDIMGIDIDCSVDRLKQRFRYLSKRYHPDTCPDGMGDFGEMRKAYSLLLRLKTEENGFQDLSE